MQEAQARFALGTIVGTSAALAALLAAGASAPSLLARHRRGDFGQLDPADAQLQERALAHEHDPGQRVRMMSVYHLGNGRPVWIITEADRSSTCILLPEEY